MVNKPQGHVLKYRDKNFEYDKIVIYAYHGLKRQPSSTPLDMRLPYIGLGLVGVLSGVFHAVLNYHSQMGDDLSMHFATAFIFQRAMTYGKSPAYRRNFGLLLISTLVPFFIYHCMADEVVLHQIVWGLMVLAVALKARNLYQTRIMDAAIKKRVNQVAWIGQGEFLLIYTVLC
jgi:dihydroceramidase